MELEGYRVVEALDGLEAFTLAQSECPDLILMDLSMPEVNGMVAAQRISELPGMSDVPIVAMTAYDTAEVRNLALSTGCSEFIAKPFDSEQLKNLINRLLPKETP